MIKNLTRLGNSSALILDKQLLQLLDIDQDTALKITVNGRQLIVEPLSDEERNMKFTAILKKTGKKNAKLFAKLAK